MTLFLVLVALITSSAMATNQTSSLNQVITIATQEMQNANYFTFVMLINMAPDDITKGGITFVMPNDKTLSEIDLSESSVVDFLLRHSIPSPLLMDHLEHFPNGSIIPTSKPGFMFKVSNDGARHFFLSNVEIISPNVCTKGSLIRCHGIDGVVQPETINPQPKMSPSCRNSSSAWGMPRPPSPMALAGGDAIMTASPPSVPEVSNRKSSSPQMSSCTWMFNLVLTFCMLKLLWS